MKFKNILKILLTNWIHLIAIYLGFYLTIVVSKIIGGQTTDSWTSVLFESLLTIPLLIFVYGLSLLGQFYLTICVLDILLFSFNTKWTTEKLIIEWIIIVMPFINAAFNYDYWSWLTISAFFLVTQLLRKKQILKLLVRQKNGIQQ